MSGVLMDFSLRHPAYSVTRPLKFVSNLFTAEPPCLYEQADNRR
jgi:hypothetical protein